jgi:hypothetical protein
MLGPFHPPTVCPYYIRHEDAVNLGVLRSQHASRNKYFVNVMSTSNPLMFHDNFCAENQIPVLIGVGPITDPRVMRLSQTLCREHGWSSNPARWIRLIDLLSAGLLPALLASSGARECPQRDCQLDRHVAECVPFLSVNQPDTSLETSFRYRAAVHVDYLCRNADNMQRGVTTAMFHESHWPHVMVDLGAFGNPGQSVVLSPACGFTSAMYGFHETPPSAVDLWVDRSWLDAKFTTLRDHRRARFPVPFDTRMIHVDRELSHLSGAQRHVLQHYVGQSIHGAVPFMVRTAFVNCALDFPEVVSSYWSCALPLPDNVKENPGVPPIEFLDHAGSKVTWRNVLLQ